MELGEQGRHRVFDPASARLWRHQSEIHRTDIVLARPAAYLCPDQDLIEQTPLAESSIGVLIYAKIYYKKYIPGKSIRLASRANQC